MILTLKEPTIRPIDASPITTELIGRDLETVLKTPIRTGAAHVELGELFTLTMEAEERLVIRAAHPCLHYVGAGMTTGELVAEGDIGDYAAHSMRGGRLRVLGNAGAYTACNMSGGSLLIQRDAGDALGGALTGSSCGLNGGEIIVAGSAGERAGERMRRGMLVILGDCGDYCAANMIAGTIIVLGRLGQHAGYEMRRGTLLVNDASGFDGPFFARSGSHAGFTVLLARYIRNLDQRLQSIPDHCRKRYVGDLSVGGQGEVLVL